MPGWVGLTAIWALVALCVIGVGYTFLAISGGGSGFLWHMIRDTDEDEPDIEDEDDDTA
jgi:hypothetical protein